MVPRWRGKLCKLNAQFVILVFAFALFCVYVPLCLPAAIKHLEEQSIQEPSTWYSVESPPSSHQNITKTLVVASLFNDDVSWLWTHFADWNPTVYTVDIYYARLSVPKNKGNEWSAYLTYIVDNYDDLPEVMVFIHSLRYQWHNEDPMYDGVPMLSNLRVNHIVTEGYVNLRCTHEIGCPVQIHPLPLAIRRSIEFLKPSINFMHDATQATFATTLRHLAPEIPIPGEVGIPSGSQFGLSRAAIHARPRSDYVRFRDWLYATDLDDAISGRLLEFSWHILMGKDAVHCPGAGKCFCRLYGFCDLSCPDEGSCKGRYKLPLYAKIPKGWPKVGPGKNGWPEREWWKKDF